MKQFEYRNEYRSCHRERFDLYKGKLQGLDMEGFGLYLTSHLLDKKCLWIKGVSDFADIKEKDNYHQTAAFASVAFFIYLIKEGL